MMTNRLRLVQGQTHSLSPAAAEVWITAVPEQVTATTEVRGRVLGPRCRFATTVEVAYPLRPLPHSREGVPPLTKRVLIPEPNLWDPQSPFHYRALVELWQDGQRCDQAGFDLGLRRLDLGTRGLLVNGRPVAIQGTTRVPRSQEEALALRQAGYNLLLAPVEEPLTWFTAAEFGFLMLGRLSATEGSLRQPTGLGGQVCCFGWLFGQELLDEPRQGEAFVAELRQLTYLVGLELNRVPPRPLPPGLSFLVCPEALLSAVAGINLPRIIGREANAGENGPTAGAAKSDVLGWIDGPWRGGTSGRVDPQRG